MQSVYPSRYVRRVSIQHALDALRVNDSLLERLVSVGVNNVRVHHIFNHALDLHYECVLSSALPHDLFALQGHLAVFVHHQDLRQRDKESEKDQQQIGRPHQVAAIKHAARVMMKRPAVSSYRLLATFSIQINQSPGNIHIGYVCVHISYYMY